MKNYFRFLESIRQKYQDYGVEGFYKDHANEYVNPHEPIINKEDWGFKLKKSIILDRIKIRYLYITI